MKKRMVPWVLTLAVVFAFSLVSCKADDSDDKSGKVITGYPTVDYTPASGEYLIQVTNNSTNNLVAFKGSPLATNLIGGIPGNAHDHKLKLNKELFPSTSDFVLFVVTEKDYIDNYNNLSALANNPFTTLYAFYNPASSNALSYTISEHLGGEGSITITQKLGVNMCVELKLGSPYGETLGFLYKGMPRTTFRMPLNKGTPDDFMYEIFPVFKLYDKNKNNGEIIPIMPTYSSGASKGCPLYENFALTADSPEKTIDVSSWYDNAKFVSGYAYIQVINNSNQILYLVHGDTHQTTSTGKYVIEKGKFERFQFEMPNATASFDDATLSLKTLKIKSTGIEIAVPERTVKTEYLYSIEVTGNQNTGLKLSDISVIGKFNLEKEDFSPVTSDSE